MKRMFFMMGILMIQLIILQACQQDQRTPEMIVDERVQEAIEANADKEEVFVVALKDKDGIVRGTAIMTEGKEGVQIDVKADHLTPGKYGFHIHEKGVCEAPTFETAGGHFNPENKEHGLEHVNGAHAGDLNNVVVKEDGTIDQQFTTDSITLKKGNKHSVFHQAGTSLIIHTEEDDGKSQPSGDAGERKLCGVITLPGKTTDSENES